MNRMTGMKSQLVSNFVTPGVNRMTGTKSPLAHNTVTHGQSVTGF